MSDIRKDPLSNTWVIIEPQRAARPHAITEEKHDHEEKGSCPFCESEEVRSPIAPYATCAAIFDKNGNWVTRVLANKYPALSPEPELEQDDIETIYQKLTGVGGHEILVETPLHKYFSWSTMPLKQLEAVFKNYKCRYTYWSKDPRIEYLSIFRNQGSVAGASIRHPHSQMIATPIVPPRVQTKLGEMQRHYEQSNHCLLCHMLELEIRVKDRLILENEYFAAISNFAPRFPYESLIIPKRHDDTFENISDKEIKSLASLVSELFKKFDKLLNDPPFNLIIHVSPLKTTGLLYYHWHIEIIFRLSQPAGFEWGSGIYINSVSPEEATRQLAEV